MRSCLGRKLISTHPSHPQVAERAEVGCSFRSRWTGALSRPLYRDVLRIPDLHLRRLDPDMFRSCLRAALIGCLIATLWSGSAHATPPAAPKFGPGIESFSHYDGQSKCSPW